MSTAVIFNIQRFCIHDGDGIRTTVFLKGCPLRCIWCHNPESQKMSRELMFYSSRCTKCGRCEEICSNRRISDQKLDIARENCTLCGKCIEACLNGANEMCGREISAQEAYAEVKKDSIFYETSGGGMTVSGGEPAMQSDFTLELLELAAKDGMSRAIETCGYGERSFYERANELGTTFLFDLKAADSEKHKRLTGVGNEKIISNLEYLAENNADIVIRLPMIPDINDSDYDIEKMSEIIKRLSGKIKYAEIMPYHNLGISKEEGLGRTPLVNQPNVPKETVEKWIEKFAEFCVCVKQSK